MKKYKSAPIVDVKNVKKKQEPKLDFGPTKEEHGWFYYVWNWKTYAFYLATILIFVVCWVEQDFISALVTIPIMFGLRLFGKIF